MILSEMPEQAKQVVDAVSIGGTAAVLIGWLPTATAVLTFLWVAVRLWETRTVQRIIKRVRERAR